MGIECIIHIVCVSFQKDFKILFTAVIIIIIVNKVSNHSHNLSIINCKTCQVYMSISWTSLHNRTHYETLQEIEVNLTIHQYMSNCVKNSTLSCQILPFINIS